MTMDGGASQYRLRRTRGEGEGSDLGQMPRYLGAELRALPIGRSKNALLSTGYGATSPRKWEGVPQTRAL
jgi:hypothetical protein